jgi:hypothetical protein
MPILENEWVIYRDKVPPEAPDALIETLRTAFFSGAFVLYEKLISIRQIGEINTAEAEQALLDLHDELVKFATEGVRYKHTEAGGNLKN